MKVNLDCIPCFQRQALQAVRFITDDEGLHERILREVMEKLLGLRWDSTPPEMAHEVHRLVKRLTGDRDPYRGIKRESNDLVLRLYPALRGKVEKSEDPLRTAVKLAIAGNIIDFGALREFNLRRTIKDVLNRKFAVDDYEKFKEELRDAKTLLYFADNAGELGFDRLLVETMLKEKSFERISFVVKGGPIINDATMEDALYLGLDGLPNVEFLEVSNGEPGTGPERSSKEVEGWINDHDLVISKGQGNYEGLSEFNGIFFMLIAKCPIIASDVSVNMKDVVFKYKP